MPGFQDGGQKAAWGLNGTDCASHVGSSRHMLVIGNMVQASGLQSFSLQGLSEEFLQLLRVIGVVRPTARNLGASNSDRMRINASCAHKVQYTLVDRDPSNVN